MEKEEILKKIGQEEQELQAMVNEANMAIGYKRGRIAALKEAAGIKPETGGARGEALPETPAAKPEPGVVPPNAGRHAP